VRHAQPIQTPAHGSGSARGLWGRHRHSPK